MEPLAKRQRLTYTQRSQRQEEDELNFEPEEVDKQRDPGQQLEESRAFAAYKLKSTFEHIFQKYERDFTGIGDEIDLRTGEIVVNNGHIQRLGEEGEDGYEDEDEGMLLEDAFPDSDDEDDEEEQLGYSRKQLQYGAQRVNEDEEDRILQGRQPPPADPPSMDDLDENFNQISEQTDPFMPSKRLLDPCDDRRQPESPNGPEDEDLPQERAVIEVQDSDGSDGLSDLGCPEALETILETLDMPPVVLPTSSEPVPEDIPSSPPLSHTTRTLKRKTELAPEAQTSITEVEQAVATIPPSTPATQKEAAVVEITSSEEPLPTTNTKSKTRKKDNPSTPRTQRETPHKPSSRRSILSLRPEDADEDEISLVLDSWSGSNRTDHAHLPLRTVGFSSVRRNTLAKLAGSSPLRGRSVMSSAGVTASGGGMRFRTAREGFGGMSTPTKRKREVPGSPAGSLIQTPGGRLRRCGVDGFSCDRDFCFTCLGG
ncbi:hypothetical protein ACHAQA_000427 [Verticillium albo-atrum]